MNDDVVMDLDLNQEPLVEQPPPQEQPPSFGYGPLLYEPETAHVRIEDRIRQLEAVTARTRQRQRWRQERNNPELSYMAVIEPDVGVGNQNQESNVLGDEVRVEEIGGVVRGRNSKRDISQLVKALEMDLDSKKTDNGGNGDDDESGGFFDCNICLEMARDPILTCCGHLFCWSCFHQLSYVDSSAKECPVCKGEVTDTSITPIYGNGKNQAVLKLESRVKIPPRPRARRVESIRQQRVIRGISHIPVAEALRRIRIGIGIGSIGENPLLRGLNSVGSAAEANPTLLHNSEAGGSRRHRSRQFSRVISESAASLSSISSALNNAERLVEDLETYINERLLRRADAQILPSNQEVNTYLANTVDIQPEPQNAEMNLPVSHSSSSQRSVATTVVHLDNLSTDSAVEIDLTTSQSHPSSSRRTAVSRALSLEGGTSQELRRRRLSREVLAHDGSFDLYFYKPLKLELSCYLRTKGFGAEEGMGTKVLRLRLRFEMVLNPANQMNLLYLLENEKLNDINFLDWYRILRIVLKFKGKLGMIKQSLLEHPCDGTSIYVLNAHHWW